MDEDRIVDGILIGFIITIIGLKIANIITIPWIWLLSPLWIPFTAGVIIALICGSWMISSIIIYKIKEKRK